MKKKVIVVLADGFEEIEAITPIDVLRRAGMEVMVAALETMEVKSSRGLVVKADVLFEDVTEIPDAVILPGGPGAESLGRSEKLKKFLQKMKESQKWIGAICAAPALVLGRHAMLEGKKATCYPGYENQLGPKAVFVDERVVRDGFVVTSRGPGSAMEFSLELVRQLVDERTANVVAGKMLVEIRGKG